MDSNVYIYLCLYNAYFIHSMNYYNFFENSPREYFGTSGAGAIIIAKDTGKILLLRRSSNSEEPGTWGGVGGKIDHAEDPSDTVAREIEEETGYNDTKTVYPLYVYRDGEFTYYNFLVLVPFEFTPQLNWESDNSTWVEFGKWPNPLHFGIEELLKHDGQKIKNIVDLLKRKSETIAEMDSPPAIIQSTNHFSTNFVNYIKKVENAERIGFKSGKWYPHQSPEGGLPTIGYGHKLKKDEIEKLNYGISDSFAEKLLRDDLDKAKDIVYSDIKSMSGAIIHLDPIQEEMLTDFAFNLGTIKGFPKFVRAVLDKDWDTARKEYKRTYKDSSGNRRELEQRNKIFFDRYLKNPEKINENINNTKVGITRDNVYEYKLTSPYSYIIYYFDPKNKIFSFDSIRTLKEENMNKGYAKQLLEVFFKMVNEHGGRLDVGGYTTRGEMYIKHVVERLANQYGIKLI